MKQISSFVRLLPQMLTFYMMSLLIALSSCSKVNKQEPSSVDPGDSSLDNSTADRESDTPGTVGRDTASSDSVSSSSEAATDTGTGAQGTGDSATGSPSTESKRDEGSSTDSMTTESDTGTSSSDLIDQSNIEPLEPTADCMHPEVAAECEDGWCRIPHGCFIFGSVDAEGGHCRSKYSEDQAQVTLTRDFEIRQHEATQAEWQAAGFDLPNPISKNPCPDCPITWITIYEAMAYCNALSRNAGYVECYDLSNCTGTLAGGCPDEPLNEWGCATESAYICTGDVHEYKDPYACPGYRLPTTAEWEYTARAGTRTATYNGDQAPDTTGGECYSDPVVDPIAWYCANTDTSKPAYIPVGQKAPNGFGLYDMLGNVGEYCASSRHNNSLNYLVGHDGPLVDPAPPLEEYEEHMEVVLRSPYYLREACYMRSAFNYPGAYANERSSLQGFRAVRTLGTEAKAIVSAQKVASSHEEKKKK